MREEILDIASSQIKSGGYSELSFEAIATQLNISRANIHHHFKTKENLAKEVLQKYIAEIEEKKQKLLEASKGDFKKLISLLEDNIWKEVEASDTAGICACVPMFDGGEKIPESLQVLSFTFYEYAKVFFSEQIKISQKNGMLKSTRNSEEIGLEGATLLLGLSQRLRAMNAIEIKKNINLIPERNILKQWVNGL